MKHYLTALLLSPTLAFCANSVAIDCPNEVEARTLIVAATDWQIVSTTELRKLERVGFLTCAPSERAFLVPDKALKKGAEVNDVWLLPAKSSEALSVACYYTGLDSFIAKRLPDKLRQCEARYRKTKTGSRLILLEASCQ